MVADGEPDRAAMVGLPPVPPVVGWRTSTRLGRDHYVRVASNDYSVHPAAIGRLVEVVADLEQVTVACGGRLVARHERCWDAHQSLTDPDHATAATAMRGGAVRTVTTTSSAPAKTPAETEVRASAARQLRRTVRRRRHRQHRRYRRGGVMTPRTKTATTSATGSTEAGSSARNVAAELAHLTRVLKAPSLAASIDRLAERTRAESWTHEEFLAACL